MLLNISRNAKTIKSEKVGILTGVLYLAPHNLSGRQVCPFASAGCIAACLNTAGRGAMNCTQTARVKKTQKLFDDRGAFLRELHSEIGKLRRKAARQGMRPAVRLNGTSDLPWEKFTFLLDGQRVTLMSANPDIIFYDYTKNGTRARKSVSGLGWPSNYQLTFSRAEDNDAAALKMLRVGVNVAVVFNDTPPSHWHGYETLDGDAHDARMLDGRGMIVALTAKGKAKRDQSGFVVSVGLAKAA